MPQDQHQVGEKQHHVYRALQHVRAPAREGEHADDERQGEYYRFHVIEAEDHVGAVQQADDHDGGNR